MRRSEAIQIILNYMEDPATLIALGHIHNGGDLRLGKISLELQAKICFQELEAAGIKPPQLPGISSFELAMGGDYNRWEEEDE